MLKPLITIDDFKGGATLNEKLGRKDQFHLGRGLDFTSRQGFLTIRPAFTRMQLSSSTDVTTPMQGILYTLEDSNVYFGGDDTKIYKQTSTGSITSDNDSAETGAIRGLIEYKGHMYYPQDLSIGRSDLAGTPTYDDDWAKNGVSSVVIQNSTYKPLCISGDNNLYMGNGQYVAKIDGSATIAASQALDLQAGWEIQTLANFGIPFLAIGANFLPSSSSTSQVSKMFLWDRISASWNDEIEIPENSIYAMFQKGGYLWVWAGSNALSIYVVPLGSRMATKVFTFENDNQQDYSFKVYPNAVGYKDGRIFFAVSGNTSASTNTPIGVYSMNNNPSNLQLNIEFSPSVFSYSGQIDYKSIGLISYTSQVAKGILYFSADNGTTENLVRENLYTSDDMFSNATGVYETFYFDAPPGKKLYFDGFGVDCSRRIASSGDITLSYKADNETNTTDIKAQYTVDNGIGFYVTKAVECYTIKFLLTMAGATSGDNRIYIKRLFATGKLIDDTR